MACRHHAYRWASSIENSVQNSRRVLPTHPLSDRAGYLAGVLNSKRWCSSSTSSSSILGGFLRQRPAFLTRSASNPTPHRLSSPHSPRSERRTNACPTEHMATDADSRPRNMAFITAVTDSPTDENCLLDKPVTKILFSSSGPSTRSDGFLSARDRQSATTEEAHPRRATPSSAAVPPPYAFPVSRALRYIRRGRRCYHRMDGQIELQEWLNDLSRDFLTQSEVDEGAWGLGYCCESGPTEGTLLKPAEPLLAEVSSFAKYHAHHVLVTFKELRRQTEETKARRTAHHPGKHENGRRDSRRVDGRGRKAHGDARDSPLLRRQVGLRSTSPPYRVPPAVLQSMTQLLFDAAVLLHLSGLFGVAEAHVERLLEVCFSASVFLSQDAAAAAAASRVRHQGERTRRQNHVGGHAYPMGDTSDAAHRLEAMNPVVTLASSITHGGRPLQGLSHPRAGLSPDSRVPALPVPDWADERQLHSLHWAVVHFAAGVQSWELLQHTRPLQHLQRTQNSYERLLQAHAAMLCELTRGCVTPTLWHELLLLKVGARAEEARRTWFMGATAAKYADFFPTPRSSSSSSVRCSDVAPAHHVPPRLQQRRLQLLPLFWLSCLCTKLVEKRESAAARPYNEDDAGATRTGLVVPKLTWKSARHALASVLPLFTCDAPLDVTGWSILHLLYLSPQYQEQSKMYFAKESNGSGASFNTNGRSSSLTEVCAIVSRLEHNDVMVDLAAVLPRHEDLHKMPPQTSPSNTLGPLAHFLRQWMDASAAAATSVSAATRAFCGVTSPSDLVVGHAPSPPIRDTGQLYYALLNVPLSVLYLPASRKLGLCDSAFTAASPSESVSSLSTSPGKSFRFSVTEDGVRLLNQLLLRILLQWRRSSLRESSSWVDSADATVSAAWKPRAPTSSQYLDAPVTRPNSVSRNTKIPSKTLSGEAAGFCSPHQPDGEPRHTNPAAWKTSDEPLNMHLYWEKDLMAALRATQHLQHIMSAAVEDDQGSGEVHQDNFLAVTFVVPTAQAAARALAEQLASAHLPWRLSLLYREKKALSGIERQMLCSLDSALRHVLLFRVPPPQFEDAKVGSCASTKPVGVLPVNYRSAFEALLKIVP